MKLAHFFPEVFMNKEDIARFNKGAPWDVGQHPPMDELIKAIRDPENASLEAIHYLELRPGFKQKLQESWLEE
mgnify:CR=1 FL=1